MQVRKWHGCSFLTYRNYHLHNKIRCIMKNIDFRTGRYHKNNRVTYGSDFYDVLSASLTIDINR